MSTNKGWGTCTVQELKASLAGGPGRFASLMAGLPDALARGREGAGTWSPIEVIGHVLDAELKAWIPRLEIILRGDVSVVLPTFDRFAHLTRYQDAPVADLLVHFAEARSRNLQRLDTMSLDARALAQVAIHGTLGPVTTMQLLHTWTAHDWSHHAQIVRTVASGMRTGVGPWASFLTVMQPRVAASS